MNNKSPLSSGLFCCVFCAKKILPEGRIFRYSNFLVIRKPKGFRTTEL